MNCSLTLNISPKVDMGKYIRLYGKMDIFINGTLNFILYIHTYITYIYIYIYIFFFFVIIYIIYNSLFVIIKFTKHIIQIVSLLSFVLYIIYIYYFQEE